MPDFFAIVHDGLPSLKAPLMSPAEHATRETPQIDYCKCNTADYNAKKKSIFCPGSYREPEAEYNAASSYNDNKGTQDV